MAETNTPQTSGAFQSDPKRPRGLGRRLFWAFLIVGGILTVSRPLTAHRLFGHQGHWGMSGSSPYELERRWSRMADWLFERVDATPEQRTRMQVIQDSLTPDLYAFRNEHLALDARLRQTLGANPVDREELERIRADTLDLADRASRRAVDSFAQMLDIFTPEQREEFLELWQAR
jgi:Spy/CpxP family protein refolding chaperone